MLKVGVVGAGWVTAHRHIPALARSGRCEIIGVVDTHLDRAQALAAKYRLPNAGETLDADWVNQANAFSIGVSPTSHFAVASELLARGKHVLLEKPMCLAVAEAEQLATMADERGLTLAVVHNFQFSRSTMRVKRLLASGRLGRITALHGFQWSSPARRLPSWYEQLPLGLFFDESPHLLYMLQAFGGAIELKECSVLPSSSGRATPALVQARFDAAGLPATLLMNFEAPISEWQFMVVGERAAAVIDIFRDILVVMPADGQHLARDVTRSSWSLLWGHASGFVRSGWRMVSGQLSYGNDEIVRRFLDSIEGRAALGEIDARHGIEVLKLQHTMVDQARLSASSF